ncbi:MAG: MBL fold metallo-hydrolase [Proteobacteria bacterium]|nr:MBL fold metallo-hydrolase [Pseudomonadota bacterium]
MTNSTYSHAQTGDQDDSSFDIKVTLLGTGTPNPNPNQLGQSILVEAGGEKLLFDCGRGCGHRLGNLGANYLKETSHLFFTHLHSDHTTGTADYFINGWVRGRTTGISVFGPDKTEDLIRHIRLAYEQDAVLRLAHQSGTSSRSALEYSVTNVYDGFVYEINGVKVTAIEVDHGVVKPAFGYRIDYAGRSVVISGDTAYSENLIEKSQDVDVLIHEVMAPALQSLLRNIYKDEATVNSIISLHTLPSDAGKVFTQSKTRMGIYTHLINNPAQLSELIEETRKTWNGPLEVGEDLMVIEIGNNINIRRP